MSNFIIRKNLFASRCEICHQTDLFNQLTNICGRCNNVQVSQAINLSRPRQTRINSNRFLFNFSKAQVLWSVFIGLFAVVGGISAILPNFLGTHCTRGAGALAIESMRLIHSAEATYQAGVGDGNFGAAEDLLKEQLIDEGLADAFGANGKLIPKMGYIFYLHCEKPELGKLGRFSAVATYIGTEKNRRNFFVDEDGVIRYCYFPEMPTKRSPVIGE